ncbi:MAG: trypsin-like peptidase domain-containing protein [Anaerolineales bacterium]|nr:trypsin-like peptidase domain-containing protein [Anaerolineales bacterium]
MKQKSVRQLFILFIMTAMLALAACGGLAEQTAQTQPVAQTAGEALVLPTAVSAIEETNFTPTDQVAPAPVQVTEQQVAQAKLDLFAQEQAFVALYEQVNGAVVNVQLSNGEGSGFVIDQEGHIVTNNHVVADGGPIQVNFANGRSVPATLIGTDPDSDVAVIKVDMPANELTVVPLGDSDSLKVGQIVIAIGSPFGLDNTMTTGIVSGLSRTLPGGASASRYQVPDVIQTDAAINPGNSGGPLLDLNGRVIGINTAIESPVRASSGVGFAVPVNVVKAVVPQIINGEQVQHPWLGIAGGTITPAAAEQMGLNSEQRGVVVSTVTAGGPAAQAGLRGGDANTGLGGDVIVGIDGQVVNEFDDLLGYIIQHTTVGQTVTLQILRGGQPQTVQITLGARPASG